MTPFTVQIQLISGTTRRQHMNCLSRACLIAQLVWMALVHRLRGKQEGVVFHLVVAVDVGAVSVAVRSHVY